MIQSDHNFAHEMTAEQSWSVQICDLIGSLESYLQQKDNFCKIFIMNFCEMGLVFPYLAMINRGHLNVQIICYGYIHMYVIHYVKYACAFVKGVSGVPSDLSVAYYRTVVTSVW